MTPSDVLNMPALPPAPAMMPGGGPPAVGIVITLGELVQAEEALQRLVEVKLPAKTAYQVAKLMRLVLAETQHFHKQREEAIRELGAVNPENSNEVRVTPANVAEFGRRITELYEVQTRIDWTPLKIDDLPDITAGDLIRLSSLVV